MKGYGTCCVGAVLALTALLGSSAINSANASLWLSEPVDDASVAACVEEIGRQADYSGAGSVRHNVEVEERRGSGHKLTISTTILDEANGNGIRAYSTVCTVTSRKAPLEFRIREVRR